MIPIANYSEGALRWLFTDIDDTLTTQGKLPAASYQALWQLAQNQIAVIPVTGRPAGWCEMIARFWPVAGVIGENGGFYFRYQNSQMGRHFYFEEDQRKENQQRLEKIRQRVKKEVPKSQVASDQFCRIMDLAIDYCEDIPPLSEIEVEKIVDIFNSEGAQAKISSIHVNGWFGDYDKLTMCRTFLKNEYGVEADSCKNQMAFCGDSPNDEPMFGYFPISFGVANLLRFQSKMVHLPKYIASKEGGSGFAEIVAAILSK